MFGKKSLFKFAPTVLSMLKVQGIDVDVEFNNALEFIPTFIKGKQKEYQEKNPNVDINLMVSFYEDDIHLIPVGLTKEDDKIIQITRLD